MLQGDSPPSRVEGSSALPSVDERNSLVNSAPDLRASLSMDMLSERLNNSSSNNNNSMSSLNASASLPIGFGSIQQAKRHYRKENSRRRLQSAARTVRAMNRLSSFSKTTTTTVPSEQTPLTPGSPLSTRDASENDNNNVDETSNDGKKPNVWLVLFDFVFGKYISIFLVCAPFAIVANIWSWGPLWMFWLNFFTMVPLASILGDFTQEVALHTNQVVGGLINATFGNTVEVLVGIQALLADQYRVVQASMLGSIFSNLLLVLGSCFFFGGLRKREQSFNRTAATANMSLLALSSIALILPTPFAQYYVVANTHVLNISRAVAVFLMFMYLQLLYFQLRTHAYLFDDDDDEEAELDMTTALIGLTICTLAIAFFSQFLINSINGFVLSTGVSQTFVGLIILPIVGNAVEHVTAVTVAMKDKMDLAMGGMCIFIVVL